MIRSHHGRTPQIAASAYIDPQAVVIGDVSIGELSSVWPCVVIRGDVNWIRIGSRTNIQDGSILHVYKDTHPLVLADMVTVGHGAILHGCTIESRVLIGLGAHRRRLECGRRHFGSRGHSGPAGQLVHGASRKIPPRAHARRSGQYRGLRHALRRVFGEL
jgi:hypothetical protein